MTGAAVGATVCSGTADTGAIAVATGGAVTTGAAMATETWVAAMMGAAMGATVGIGAAATGAIAVATDGAVTTGTGLIVGAVVAAMLGALAAILDGATCVVFIGDLVNSGFKGGNRYPNSSSGNGSTWCLLFGCAS